MVAPKILHAKVFHKRFFPRVNQFSYKLYYLVFPISKISELSRNFIFRVNKHGLMSFFEKDHFPTHNFSEWIKNLLLENQLKFEVGEVVLIAMPRVFGYVFNPVSFWFCFDKESNLKAVLAEVRNTFGESHNYLCYNSDKSKIKQSDVICVEKMFHVSPFIERNGFYKFKFLFEEKSKKIGVWIDHYDSEGKKLLATSILGKTTIYNTKNLFKCLIFYPLVTIKTILMIHWQALKIFSKGIKYIPLPRQFKERFSTIKNLKK